MRRNPFALVRDEINAAAARAVRTPADETAPAAAASSAVRAGLVGTTSGEWESFGLLDVTALGEFRVGS